MALLLLAMFLWATGPVSCAPPAQWSGTSALDAAGSVVLSWKNEPGSITMEIQAPTLGYVGLGISPSGTMMDADMVTGWVANGKSQLKDRYSLDHVLPEVDTKQDYQLLAASQNATHTTLKFKRKLNTGDAKDKEIKAGPITLIYAFGPLDAAGADIDYHDTINRGAKTLTLITK